MLAGFVLGIVKDRKLLRQAQTDLAIRGFAGYRLDEALPDHSSLTRMEANTAYAGLCEENWTTSQSKPT